MLQQSTVTDDGMLVPGVSIPLSSFTGIVGILSDLEPHGAHCVAGYTGNVISVVDSGSGYEFLRLDTGGRGRGCALEMNGDRIWAAICSKRKDGQNDVHLEKHSISQRCSLNYKWGVPLHYETIFDSASFLMDKGRVGFVTGSEDCSSRISIWSNGSIRFSKPLSPQASGVRAVCCTTFTNDQSTLVVVGGSKLSLQFFVAQHDESMTTKFIGNGRMHKEVARMDHRINALAFHPKTKLLSYLAVQVAQSSI